MACIPSPLSRPSRYAAVLASVLLAGTAHAQPVQAQPVQAQLVQAPTPPTQSAPTTTHTTPAHPPAHSSTGTAASKTPEGKTTPGKTPPVVQAPRNSHAEKHTPPGKPGATGKPGTAKATPAPAPAPEPAGPAAPAAAAEPAKGSVTGMPLPRWASLRTDEVNLRAGPGTRYPIDWVYKRRDLPVQIEREFEVWRLVEDQDGIKGWVHQATLVGRRSFVVTGAEHSLRDAARDDAGVVAIVKPGVIGRIRSCAAGADWCEVQVADYRGWLKRSDFWGTYPGEAVQ